MKAHCHYQWQAASNSSRSGGASEEEEITRAREREVGDFQRVFIEIIPGGDQEEVTSRAMGGEHRSRRQGGGRVEMVEQSGREGGD